MRPGIVIVADPNLECGIGNYTYGTGGLQAASPPSHDEGERGRWLGVWPAGCRRHGVLRRFPAWITFFCEEAKARSTARTLCGMILGNPAKWLETLPFSASFLVASPATPFSPRKALILKSFVEDMDLVCLIDNKEAALHASDLVAMIGDLLERGKSSRKTIVATVIDESMT